MTLTPSGLLIDIDGTLLGPDESVSPRLSAAIAEAKKLMPVALASGRAAKDVAAVALDVGLDGIHIGDNGAALVEALTGATLRNAHIPGRQARKIINAAKALGADFFSSSNGQIQESKQEIDSCKLNLITIRASNSAEAGDWRARFETDLLNIVPSVGSSGRHYVNFTKAGVDKGRGARLYANELGIEAERIIAIGDGHNDLPMFEVVGLAVAMGNAPQTVKQTADHSTLRVEDDGAAEAIEKYVLNRI